MINLMSVKVPGDLPDNKNYDEMLGDKYSEASEN